MALTSDAKSLHFRLFNMPSNINVEIFIAVSHH